jgi:hypothetical protein
MDRLTALHPAHRGHDGIDGAARQLGRYVRGAVLRPGDVFRLGAHVAPEARGGERRMRWEA